jgi:hypothetical protein
MVVLRMRPDRKQHDGYKTEMRWLHDLQSSSFPLEYSVARMAASRGYSVTPDFTYTRIISGRDTECSIDVVASNVLPGKDANEAPFAMQRLLLECKYRRPGVVWLFLPALQKPLLHNDSVRLIEWFSTIVGVQHCDLVYPNCYKGIELDLIRDNKNHVSDQELRHGLEQLQYSMLACLGDLIRIASAIFPVGPDFLSAQAWLPVLVTNAPLYIAKQTLPEIDFTNVNCIDDLADTAQVLTVDLSCGPQFNSDLSRVSAAISPELHQALMRIDAAKRSAGGPPQLGSIAMLAALKNEIATKRWFSRIVVCHIDQLENLIDDFDKMMRTAFLNATRVKLGT